MKTNKSAKELFEELGYYELKETDNDIFTYKQQKYGIEITFNLRFKFLYSEKNNYDYKLLVAISKQIEELGWDNEC